MFIGPTLPAYLNQDDFYELLALLQHAKRGCSAYVIYNSLLSREETFDWLTRLLAPLPVYSWTYTTQSPYPLSYLDQISADKKNDRAVIFLFDVEQADNASIKSLDYNREVLNALPHSLIFWVTAPGLHKIATQAEHFWAQRIASFDLRIHQPEKWLVLEDSWVGHSIKIETPDDAKRQLSLYKGLLAHYLQQNTTAKGILLELNNKIGQLLYYLGQSEEALSYLHTQISLAEQLNDDDLRAQGLANLARLEQRRLGQPSAKALFEQALQFAKAEQTKATILYQLASCVYQTGEAITATRYLNQAQALFNQTGDKLGQANVLQAIGDVQAFQDDRAAALESYRLAQALFNQTGDKQGQANVLQAIGDFQAFQNDRAAALESYRLAQALYDQTGDKLGQANVLVAMAGLSKESSLFEQAIVIYTSIQDIYSLARAQLYYGLACLDSGNAAKGKQLLQTARTGWLAMHYDYGVQLIDEHLANLPN